jgi:hypothetical protein
MPFSTTPSTTSYSPSEPLPQHLDHKPVYALPYEHFDGMWANETDVRYISIGIAQYDPGEISIKTMRHTGKKWTRQAEELPLHRVIDMTLFLTKALFDCQDGIVTIPPNTFPNQTSTIRISREELRTRRELARYDAFLERNALLFKERLQALAKVLDELKRTGKI